MAPFKVSHVVEKHVVYLAGTSLKGEGTEAKLT